MYVSISSDEKFELSQISVSRVSEQKFEYSTGTHSFDSFEEMSKDTDYKVILNDKRRRVFRFPRDMFHVLQLKLEIKIPLLVKIWSALGAALGIGTILALIFSWGSNIQFLSPLAAGVIAGLIALRLVLFHDVELLKLWHILYIVLILSVAIALLLTIFYTKPLIQ